MMVKGAVVRPFAEAGVGPRSTQRLATHLMNAHIREQSGHPIR